MQILKKIRRTFGLISIPLLALPLFVSCAPDSGFYVANFESYINSELVTNLRNENDVNYTVFSTNEEAERQFSRDYDVAIPSSYVAIKLIQEGKVEPINWSEITNGNILTADDALVWFSYDAQRFLGAYDLDNSGKPNDHVKDNLLYWTIPYFAQDLVIGYKTDSLVDPSPIPSSLPISEAVSTIIDNVGEDKEFNHSFMIDDVRTVYGFSKRIEGSNSVNPKLNENSIYDFSNTYKSLDNILNGSKILLSTDSGVILNDFAIDSGSDVMISYNGDLLYSIYGGDGGDDVISNRNKTFHVYRPVDSISQAVDLIIVNKEKHQEKNVEQKNNTWDVVRKLGFDIPYFQDPKFQNILIPELKKLEKSLEYWENSWSYKNFDYVNYTPMIKSLYDYLIDTDEYFDPETIEKKIIEIGELVPDLIDSSIDNEQQFNMNYAYMEAKSRF